MQGFLVAAPDSTRPVVLRDRTPTRVLVSGVQGPKGPPGGTVEITGANAIAVVETLPASPDPDTIYITTT